MSTRRSEPLFPPLDEGGPPSPDSPLSGVQKLGPWLEEMPFPGAPDDGDPELSQSSPLSWRHRRPSVEETLTDLSEETWGDDGLVANSDDASGAQRGFSSASGMRPLTTFQPTQCYPSYAPPPAEPAAGRAFVIKVLDRSSELIQAFRLRYAVFSSLGYIQQPNRAALEIDEFDAYAIPFGAIAVDTQELVGTLRLITRDLQPFYAPRIDGIVAASADPDLLRAVARERGRSMPSMTSLQIVELLDRWNAAEQPIEELSRTITHPSYRRWGISRGLMEFGLAYAMVSESPILVGACLPEHEALYARYGYQRLPGTTVTLNDSVGQLSTTVVCDTSRLPHPTWARVAGILAAMRAGEPECLLEAGLADGSRLAGSRYHFANHLTARARSSDLVPGGAYHALC